MNWAVAFAGARSFGLIGLIGGLGALLADRVDNVTVFAATLIVVGAVIAIGYLSGVRDGSRGVTTELAAITTFMAGGDNGELSNSRVANAIVLAAASNTVVKGGLVWSIGTRALRRLVIPAAIGAVVTSVALAFVA